MAMKKAIYPLSGDFFKHVGKKKSYHDVINEGEQRGFLIEVCAGCGNPTSGRDCGCPAGTNLRWK